MSEPRRIAVIGTGIMGAPMASRLAQAGHRVHAWNRSHAKAEALARHGVTIVDTPAAAVADADVVLIMLSSGPVCDALLCGDDGLIARMRHDSSLLVMSSIPVETAQRQARESTARGIHYLDAPVSGGEQGAIDGTLAIMAGGEAGAFAALCPILEQLGHPVHVGPAGTGELTKLANQIIVANTIATVAEALLLAEHGGADLSKVREALLGGFADSTILRTHAPRMIDNDFRPGGPAKWQSKDTHTAMQLAQQLGLDLPISRRVDALFHDMLENGDGDLDHSALIRELRRHNRLPV